MNQNPFGEGGLGDGESFEELARRLQSLLGNGGADLSPEERRELSEKLGLPEDPAALQQMMSQARNMMFSMSNPESSWTQARESARQAASAKPVETSEKEKAEVRDAFRLASLWLDESTSFEAPAVAPRAYSPRQWAEASFAAFKDMTEPVAASLSQAMKDAVASQMPEEMKAMLGQSSAMMDSMAQSVFALQLGQSVGTLALEVLSASDIGVPLVKDGLALVPANIAGFAEGLEVGEDEVRIYIALREEAHARLFHRAPWLRAHVFSAIRDFAEGIEIDTDKIGEAAREIDPSDAGSLEQVLSGGVFQPANTPAQEAALERLETLLALIEGWVDVVANQAAARLPGASALAETIRRRRATQGPAEQTFARLVGLELRPRRLRDAASLFRIIEEEKGQEGRDSVWSHPDLIPGSQDLDDPAGYNQRQEEQAAAEADVDAELAKLLAGGYDSPEEDRGSEEG
ncbi:zinc-dependent metalloprotease [Arthrobacter sp. UM1]|uniref:zinc-dependent metalloprotease n=1 Tax=Arthrobacter sp. UM1 TaxID=2766776 RepID=UPI001CF6D808|nr:zinc-dependent metalloprotease [Arthrobacter sp. UM1]MCB4207796.1 zinc-dependent metalloprotease [Arthrobacter sp. UM1]